MGGGGSDGPLEAELVGPGLIRLRGEFDEGDLPVFLDVIDLTDIGADDTLVIDLTDVTFFGSAGVSALLRLRRDTGRVSLRGAGEQIRRVLDVAGVTALFDLE